MYTHKIIFASNFLRFIDIQDNCNFMSKSQFPNECSPSSHEQISIDHSLKCQVKGTAVQEEQVIDRSIGSAKSASHTSHHPF